jgi:hypothetical protein
MTNDPDLIPDPNYKRHGNEEQLQKGKYIGKYGYLHLITAILRESRSTDDERSWLMELKELLFDAIKDIDKGEARGKEYGRSNNRGRYSSDGTGRT